MKPFNYNNRRNQNNKIHDVHCQSIDLNADMIMHLLAESVLQMHAQVAS